MRTVLVTGATGFIGFEVARQLAARGIDARLMVRRRERGRLLANLGARIVYGDLSRPASLERAAQGVDTVLHLAARATFEHYERLRPTIVGGSLALMQAARRAGVEHFVFASSMLVYGDNPDRPIDASTAPDPQIGYGKAKVEAEAALREAAGDVGLANVRLPHVYGARSYLFERLRQGRVILPGRGENRYSHLHADDAARLLIEVAARRWTGTSPVADESPRSWNEFFGILEAHYGRLRLLRLPAPLALCGAALLELLTAPLSRPTLHTADTVRGWLLHLPVQPGLLWKDLGIEPRFPTLDTGIPASLDEAVAFRWLHPVADPARG